MKRLVVSATGLAAAMVLMTAPANAQLLSIGFGGGYSYPAYSYYYPAYSYPTYAYPPPVYYPPPAYYYPPVYYSYPAYYYPAPYYRSSLFSLNLF